MTVLPERTARRTGRRCTLGLFAWLTLLASIGVGGQAPKIDTSKIGPQVGSRVPDFSGTDQFGRQHTLASSLGVKGAMLVFFRSADW